MCRYGFLVAAASLWLAACGSARKPEQSTTKPACTGCHGDPSRAAAHPLPAAPPVDTRGGTDSTSPGVGAHQQHLNAARLHKPIACSECHPVPEDTQHAALPLQFNWGSLASGALNSPTGAPRVSPQFDASALTCSNYCHGATLHGGSNTSPVWNRVGAGQADCGTCHGVPPPAPHPAVSGVTSCHDCHAPTVDENGAIVLTSDSPAHMNGKIDFGGGGGDCTGCHGDAARTTYDKRAPPRDTMGNTAESAPGVGAHRSHLAGGPIRGPVECQQCHGALPTDLEHANGPLKFDWGPLATGAQNSPTGAARVQPQFDANALTCSNYCHGATIAGGSNKAPVWNVTDGSQMACGTCHGAPPPAPHPQVTTCQDCHADTVVAGAGGALPTINTAGGLHINGRVDFGGTGGTCTGCHGDPNRNPVAIRPAPPIDTRGNSDPSAAGVGAHQAHLNAGPIAGPIACEQCHRRPTDLSHVTGTVDFAWGALASTGGVQPAFDFASLTCTNYCHGATLPGGANRTPIWNAGSSQAACGACHGVPPPPPHPAAADRTRCNDCHAGTVDPSGNILVGDGKHVNGSLDFGGSGGDCTGCHGDPNRQTGDKAGPPRDTRGNTDASSPGVGAHQRHLQDGPLHTAFACTNCHESQRPTDLSHANGTVDFQWAGLASEKAVGAQNQNNATPTIDRTAHTCSNYCHGQTLQGGNRKTPTWTVVDGSQMQCDSCHGLPPGGTHPKVTQGDRTTCVRCHSRTVDASGTIDVAGGLHVNGRIDFSGSGDNLCTGCHGTDTQSRPARNRPAPPIDLSGSGDSSSPGVGAHQQHLAAGRLAQPLDCTECHAAYPTDLSHIDGDLNLGFPHLARSGAVGAVNSSAANPSFDAGNLTCTNYCHGQTLLGGSNKTPRWTGGQGEAACGTCHGLPPPSPHPQVSSTSCADCHAATVSSGNTIDVGGGRHLNGRIDFAGSGGDCTGCHGDPARTTYDKRAPPRDSKGNTAETAPGVGAHRSHLLAGTLRGPLACNDCHTVPSDLSHANGTVDLNFGALARTAGASPSFDTGNLTCANYCHGQTLGGGSKTTPTWNRVGQGEAECGTCHGLPPRNENGTHHGFLAVSGQPITRSNCNICHADTVSGGNIIIGGNRHINGQVDIHIVLPP